MSSEMTIKKLKCTTAIPDYVDSMGFDNVLREVALYAETCADIPGQNEAVRRVFMRVMSSIAACADEIESLLTRDESVSVAMRQFQD